MKRKLFLIAALLCLSSPLLTGCKNDNDNNGDNNNNNNTPQPTVCECKVEDSELEYIINPTREREGVRINKCSECEKLSYLKLPMLNATSYEITFTPPYYIGEKFYSGYTTYYSTIYGKYNIDYDFNEAFNVETYTEEIVSENYKKERTKTNKINFYGDRRLYQEITDHIEESATFTSYTKNIDGSFTFVINDELSKTYYLYTDSTFSTSLNEKTLISSLDRNNTFLVMNQNPTAYETYGLAIFFTSENGGTLSTMENINKTLSEGYEYSILDDNKIVVVEKGEDNTYLSYTYYNVNYETKTLEETKLFNEDYIEEFRRVTDFDGQTENKVSDLGTYVLIKYNKLTDNYTLSVNRIETTIESEFITVTQPPVYDSEKQEFVNPNYLTITCFHPNYTFTAQVEIMIIE